MNTTLVVCNVLVGFVLPAVVALVTKRVADAQLKSLVLLALSAVTGVVTQVLASNGSFDVKTAFLAFASTFGAGVMSHYGVLKPAGVTGSEGVIATAVQGGIG